MKVIDNRKPQGVLFHTIKIGDCCLDDENDLLMRITGSSYEVVSLYTGERYHMDKDTLVYPVKATVTIS